MTSNSSSVLPFVSGSQMKAHIVASSIQQAKKNQVPYPNESKMYGRHFVMMNWMSLTPLN
jgi:hypothetical protein